MTRRIKACSDCPFVKTNPMNGAPDWVLDVFTRHKEDPFFSHSCHKTDPKADGFRGGEKKECAGHLAMMVNEVDGTPGEGGVWDSIDELLAAYVDHFKGTRTE